MLKKSKDINPFWLLLIIPGMHIFGSCILAAFYVGPEMALSGIILSIFGWYFLPFEAIGASVILELYRPNIEQNIYRTLSIGIVIGIISAIILSPFIPKECCQAQ